MPNWCDNRVRVQAETETEMIVFRDFVKSKVDGEAFSFDSVIPMPKELQPISVDWANNNWGCKWEVSDVEVSVEDETETEYYFQTAWCPPEGVYNALVKRFPGLYISWFYDEPNMQLAGYLPY